MLIMNYIGLKTRYKVDFQRISDHIVQLIGDIPEKTNGFRLTREGKEDSWDYSKYTTVYKKVDGGLQYSDDASIYVEPEPIPEPEPVPDPEPYVPSLEELKIYKKQEIRSTYQEVKAAGFDVKLSTGKEHFPLTEEDSTFLFGKQLELAGSTEEQISYQDAENRCKLYFREDMQLIINEAMLFANYQTTYRNTLCEWVDQCTTEEELNQIVYGVAIPEEHQNEVYKKYLKQKGGDSEGR